MIGCATDRWFRLRELGVLVAVTTAAKTLLSRKNHLALVGF